MKDPLDIYNKIEVGKTYVFDLGRAQSTLKWRSKKYEVLEKKKDRPWTYRILCRSNTGVIYHWIVSDSCTSFSERILDVNLVED